MSGKRTPAMQQLDRFKKRFPDCVLFFRMGDFYEMFDDDAVEMSRALGLTLTERSPGQPMAGVPHHQLDVYLKRAVAAGYRIAIADQIQDPKDARGVVARAVTRVITPGTLLDDGLIEESAPTRIAAACAHADTINLAIVDIGSGAFDLVRLPPPPLLAGEVSVGSSRLTEGVRERTVDARTDAHARPYAVAILTDELARRRVTELLIPEARDGTTPFTLSVSTTRRPEWQFRVDDARQVLLDHYSVATLSGYGLADDDPLIAPAGALLRYLAETQTADPADLKLAGDATTLRPGRLDYLAPPRIADHSRTCILDAVTLRALEVERTIRSADVDGSLLGLFVGRTNLCRTPMGKRLIRDWLCAPLAERAPIESRQRRVALLHDDTRLRDEELARLDKVQDVARIGARLALGRANPRDIVALGNSLAQLEDLAASLDNADAFTDTRREFLALAGDLTPIAADITTRCRPDPPSHLREGGLFLDGVDADLDETRLLQRDAGQWLADYQSRLLREHDLPGLKVGYNRVFGYYIELTTTQARAAPAAFTRKQTLKNAERYITPDLKEFEDKVTTAEARAIEREQRLFDELCARAARHVNAIRRYAEIIAELDALTAFATAAQRYDWTRPTITDHPTLDIRQGRHPVLDVRLKEQFVPNDLTLGTPHDPAPLRAPSASAGSSATLPLCHSATSPLLHPTLALITGPNMAGKSTFIRQVALITLLAHTGSFVPADAASIGLTDRIFTRVGADDALHAGQSTFMVEMTETANILNNATSRSLIILDEIGRGTSTLDGLSLAWAIAEHLAGADAIRALSASSEPSPSDRAPSVSSRSPSDLKTQDSTLKTPSKPSSLQASKPNSASDLKTRDSRLKTPSDLQASKPSNPKPPPRTLFATHYHELTDLADRIPAVTNLHVAVREWGDEIVFLHRILPGPTDQSYGVHVARLAGIPRDVIDRARTILASLEVQHTVPGAPSKQPPTPQLSLFAQPHPALDHLREIKLDALTPLDAFDELRRLKKLSNP